MEKKHLKKIELKDLRAALKSCANPAIAAHSQKFFKTAKGEYGEGDRFLGIRVPVLRAQARKNRKLELKEVSALLRSAYHEERLCALFIMVLQFQGAKRAKDEETQRKLYELYLHNTSCINSWDLVDSTAHHIVGQYLEHRDRRILYTLCNSGILWERRIAIIATYYFIKRNDFDDAIRISACLVNDTEDLIHKAVGWMLREVGNRNRKLEESFLQEHCTTMPRVMLRYAIEHFPPELRVWYLKGMQ